MKSNEHEVPKVYKFAKKMGVDCLKLKTVSVGKAHPLYKDFIPQNKNYYHQGEVEELSNPKNCFFMAPGCPTISWLGKIVPCCQDYRWQHIMGNAFRENLLDVWFSRRYNLFRTRYKTGRNKLCNKKCRFDKDFKIYLKEFNFVTN